MRSPTLPYPKVPSSHSHFPEITLTQFEMFPLIIIMLFPNHVLMLLFSGDMIK